MAAAIEAPQYLVEMAADAHEICDSEAMISEFAADDERSTMVLPHMTTGQRKDVKKLLECYPELKCESYGFGQDRKLYLFKNSGGSSPRQDMRNANACALTPPERSDGDVELLRSLNANACPFIPAAPEKNTLQCFMDGPVCKLDLSSIKDCADGLGQASCADGSTDVPSSCASPISTFRKVLPWNVPMPPGLEVQNTFIHYKGPPADQRQVQSMPHGMFRKCLMEEALSIQPQKVQISGVGDDMAASMSGMLLTAGTEVVIEGLSKCPAFNGLRGTLQSLDEESGRYNILLATPSQGHKSAKVKRENFRAVPTSARNFDFAQHIEAPPFFHLSALV